ncbi:hypothetical protein ACX0G9_30075 [Flavitalea flava]
MMRYSCFTIALVLALSCFNGSAVGQSSNAAANDPSSGNQDPAPEKPTISGIRLDLNGKGFQDPLPFDIPFKIVGIKYDPALISIRFAYKKGTLKKENFAEGDYLEPPWINNFDQELPFSLRASTPLAPNSTYTFIFKIQRKLNDAETGTLKGLIADQILTLLKKRLEGRMNFELTKKEIDDAGELVISSLGLSLKHKDLAIDRAGLKDNYYPLMKASLFGLTDLYNTNFHDPLVELQGNMQFFTLALDNLDKVSIEKGFKPTDDFVNLQSSLKDLSHFTEKMDPEDPLKTAELNALLKTLQKGIESIKETIAPKSDLYKKEAPEILDMFQDLQRKLLLYKNGSEAGKEAVDKFSTDLTNALVKIIYADLIISENNIGSYSISSGYYLSMDIGVAFFPTIGRASPYLATNIYLRPVNKERHIYSGDYNFFRSFSFMVGVSFVSIGQTGRRDNLLGGSFNLLAGAGYRVTDYIRLNGGWLIFKNTNTNPLVETQKLGTNGFFSISFDYDISSVFKSLFSPPTIKTE